MSVAKADSQQRHRDLSKNCLTALSLLQVAQRNWPIGPATTAVPPLEECDIVTWLSLTSFAYLPVFPRLAYLFPIAVCWIRYFH